MDIIPTSQRLKLLEYIELLKYGLSEWLVVDMKLTVSDGAAFTAESASATLADMFKKYEGRILVCNTTNLLMLIQWGKNNSPQKLAKEVQTRIPSDTCKVTIAPPTRDGLQKIELMLSPPVADFGPLYMERQTRKENIVLIADDDMYMRSLAKSGLTKIAQVFETEDGSKVANAYQAHNPDIVLLDIHMPGLGGQEVLKRLKDLDPKAYVVMLSADSSAENVQWAQQHGARGFLTKPFTKGKLLAYVEACPTIS